MSSAPQIEVIFRRMDRRNGIQQEFASCLVCGKNFQNCNHLFKDVNILIAAWELMNTLGRKKEA